VELASLLQQHALCLLAMVTVQVALGTAAHHATKERGRDDLESLVFVGVSVIVVGCNFLFCGTGYKTTQAIGHTRRVGGG
jgi:hypothetical protein